jgi:hypothetical protein
MVLDVEALAEEGWKARKKTVKGHQYIVVRKKGRDRSLGGFNEELWERLRRLGMVNEKVVVSEFKDLKDSVAKANKEIADLKKELEKVKVTPRVDESSKLLEWKVSRCPFARSYMQNVFCSKYLWDNKPSDIIWRFPNVAFKRSAMDFNGKHRKWRFTPHPDICGLCNPVDNLFSKFNENVYKDLRRLRDDLAKNQVLIVYLKTTAMRRVMDKTHCKHLGEDGYCNYWHWVNRRLERDQKKRGDGKWYDNVKAHPIICVACPSYEKVQ